MKDTDPRLIQLVAGRYRELQGLFTIADAGLILVIGGCIGLLAIDSDPGPAFLIGTSILEFGYLTLWAAWIRPRLKMHYANHFGRAGGGVRLPVANWSLVAILGVPVLADLHVGVPVPARMAFVFLVTGAYPLWIAVRDWPYRAHWVLPALVGALSAGALGSFAMQRPTAAWQGIVSVSFAMALTIAGLLDHLLLAKTLRGERRPGTIDVHE